MVLRLSTSGTSSTTSHLPWQVHPTLNLRQNWKSFRGPYVKRRLFSIWLQHSNNRMFESIKSFLVVPSPISPPGPMVTDCLNCSSWWYNTMNRTPLNRSHKTQLSLSSLRTWYKSILGSRFWLGVPRSRKNWHHGPRSLILKQILLWL